MYFQPVSHRKLSEICPGAGDLHAEGETAAWGTEKAARTPQYVPQCSTEEQRTEQKIIWKKMFIKVTFSLHSK